MRLPRFKATIPSAITSSAITSSAATSNAASFPHLACLFAVLLLPCLGRNSGAQEPSGLKYLSALQDSLAEIIERNERSVVSIARVRDRDFEAFLARRDRFQLPLVQAPSRPSPTDPNFVPDEFATGVVVGARGLILTNYHVLGDDFDLKHNSLYVTTVDRKVYQVDRIRGADPRSDLAVLEIAATDLKPIKFGDAATLKKGHFVIALGNPYAIARDGQPSASFGMVSNLTRKAPPNPTADDSVGKTTLHHYGALIHTDAKLNLGASGGALLNLRGEMVGLTTSLAALNGYEQAAGYAIPVDDTFRRAVENLKKGREQEYGFLGVAPENLPAAEVRNGRHGARVRLVEPGTPAQRAGFQPGDVITAVNGVSIYDADGLFLNVGKLPAEATARLTFERNGRTLHGDVVLAKYHVRGAKVFTPPPKWRGMQVEHSTALPRRGFPRLFDRATLAGGVAVSEIERDSPAWKGELRVGDLVTHVNSVRVRTPADFRAAVADLKGAVKLRLAGIDPGADPIHTVEPPAAQGE